MQLINRLSNESARDYAVRFLKHNIVNLFFAPGAIISCHELANKIGISRTPLREAMQELDKIGLLKVHANSGSQISPISYRQLNEFRFVRQTMDSAVMEQVCDKIKPVDFFDFEEIIRAQQNCLKTSQVDRLLELDEKFHRRFYELAGMTASYSFMEPVWCHFERFYNLDRNIMYGIQMVEEHQELFKAVKMRDKRAVKKIIMAHFAPNLKDEQAVVAQHSEYFISDERSQPDQAGLSGCL